MITNFDEITHDLTDEEKKFIPYIINGLKRRVGPDSVVKTEVICNGLNSLNEARKFATCKMSPARLRKCINHIRRNGLLNFVIGTSAGYYVTQETVVVIRQCESMDQRAAAIKEVSTKMREYLSSHSSGTQSTMEI